MTLGLLDLSIVTDRLITQLKTYRDASQLWAENRETPTPSSIIVTGLAPDAARSASGCQLSVFLFHAAVDKFHRNSHPSGGRGQLVPEQPLALTLYFLVTAWSDSRTTPYIDEQRAMSIALQFFHEHPQVVATVPLGSREVALTLTFEPQSIDEVGRLWQAFSSPLRLSAIYRAAVVFLEPPSEPKEAKRVKEFGYNVDVVTLPILAAVGAPGGRATITIEGAGFGDTTEAQLHDSTASPPRDQTLARTTTAPSAQEFQVVDASTLHVQVPTGTERRRYILYVRPAVARPTLAMWLEVT